MNRLQWLSRLATLIRQRYGESAYLKFDTNRNAVEVVRVMVSQECKSDSADTLEALEWLCWWLEQELQQQVEPNKKSN